MAKRRHGSPGPKRERSTDRVASEPDVVGPYVRANIAHSDPIEAPAVALVEQTDVQPQAWRVYWPALEGAADAIHDVILAVSDNAPLQLRLAVERTNAALLLIQDRFENARLAQIRDDLGIQHCRWWWREDGTVCGENARDREKAVAPLGRLTDLRDELSRAARMSWEGAAMAAERDTSTASSSTPSYGSGRSTSSPGPKRTPSGPELLARRVIEVRDLWRADQLDDYRAAHEAGLIVEAAVRGEVPFCDERVMDLIRDALAGRIKRQRLDGPYTRQAHGFIAAAHALICKEQGGCPEFSVGPERYFEHGCPLIARAIEASANGVETGRNVGFAESAPADSRVIAINGPDQASHSDDFTSVNWFGTRYTFSKGHQAEVVRVLWEQWDRGGHSLSQESIAAKIGCDSGSFRMSHVFRTRAKSADFKPTHERHPAWGTMIANSGKGVYRLAPPALS